MNGTLLDRNICLLGPKWSFGGPKTDQILIFGPKKVHTAPLCNYRGPNWCYPVSNNYQTINGTLLYRNMCLLGPIRPFGGPKTDQTQIFGPKRCTWVPYVTIKGQIGVNRSVLFTQQWMAPFWIPICAFYDPKGPLEAQKRIKYLFLLWIWRVE